MPSSKGFKIAALGGALSAVATPAMATTFGDIADNLTGQGQDVVDFILMLSLVVGVGLVVKSLFMFKKASDTQGQQQGYGGAALVLAIGVGLTAVTGIISITEQSAGIEDEGGKVLEGPPETSWGGEGGG